MRVKALALMLLLSAAPAKEPTSPARAVLVAHSDLIQQHPDDQPFYRYLWVPTAAKLRDEFLIALGFHVNLLSAQGKIKLPLLVAYDVVRLDVRDYGWDKRLFVWERFAKIDFYFHQKVKVLEDTTFQGVWPGGLDPDYEDGKKEFKRGKLKVERKAGRTFDGPALWLPQKEMEALRLLTYSEAPILNAEWFFVQSARQVSIRNVQEGVGYYEWLGLKKREDFFKLTGTDEKVAIALFREWRAVVDKSGISQQSRQIVALGATSGRVWGTLDTFTQKGQGQAKRNLRRGEFAHNAEEWYGVLPNSLFVTFLSDEKGNGAESAPDKIGPDDSPLRVGRDARVHANLSCIRCHGVDKDFLKPVNDWARRTFRQGGVLSLADKDKKVTLELESQYLRDLDKLLVRDRSDYMDAVREATASQANPKGLTAPAITKLYGEAWNRYVESPLKVADCARELGTRPEKLIAGIEAYAKVRGGGDLILSSLIDRPPQELTRLEWEDSYALAMTLASGAIPLEQPEKVKSLEQPKKKVEEKK